MNERRSRCRLPVRIQASIQIVFPGDTSQPHEHNGFILNISPKGMRIETVELSHEVYWKSLLQTVPLCKVRFVLPSRKKEKALSGRMVWLDSDNSKDPAVYSYGIAFEQISEEDQEDLDGSVYWLEKGAALASLTGGR